MELESYFSHSWAAENVPLNVLVWETIANDCVLYVDRDGAESGTYYINRLEELIRKSDLFVSVLAYDEKKRSAAGQADYCLACSPGALFEVRLAERARKPRWIVYDDRTGFVPPGGGSDFVVYTPIVPTEEIGRGGPTIRADGQSWLERLRKTTKASAPPRARRAALLIDDRAADASDVGAAVEDALKRAGYRVDRIEPVHTDAEAIAVLQSTGLLVTEIGAASVSGIYGMAHALFIPTIRFIRSPWREGDIPRLLDGHPGGYQHDLILVEDKRLLAAEVQKRAEAMRDSRSPIKGIHAGSAYLRRRLYRPHKVFFSHNLATSDAEVLKQVFRKLEGLGVRAWEYRHNNKAGVVWEEELQTILDDATDVVFIFGKDFELSDACTQELKALTARRQDLRSVTPFLWGDRDKRNPEFKELHHEILPADPAVAADVIVERLLPQLQPKPAA